MQRAPIVVAGLALFLLLPPVAEAGARKVPRPRIENVEFSCRDGMVDYSFDVRNIDVTAGQIDVRGKVEAGPRPNRYTTTRLDDPPFGIAPIGSLETKHLSGTVDIRDDATFAELTLRVFRPGEDRRLSGKVARVRCTAQ